VVSKEPFIDRPLSAGGTDFRATAVSMGNPHAVVFTEDVSDINLEEIGPLFENHEYFPERVNTEFVSWVSSDVLNMRVWERGSGETFACGTGACAAVCAAVRLGRCRAGEPVTVRLTGGELVILVSEDYEVNMTGEAEKSYEGVYEYDAE
jgi:diaminopimelate epimerase